MKKLIAFLLIFFVQQLSIHAQEKSETDLILDLLKKDKKVMMRDYMALDEKQSTAFWPVYDEYTAERSKIAKDRMETLDKYVTNYANLSEDQADQYVKEFMQNDKENLNLQKKYYKKFKKEVGSVKAAQFLQMESYFQTLVKSEVQESIPFIGEIERKR